MKYTAQGKFLLSGEYLVLNGAKALATPLKHGQSLHVSNYDGTNHLKWSSYEQGELWFSANINLEHEEVIETNNDEICKRLLSLFQTLQSFNPEFYNKIKKGVQVETHLSFQRNWGLGTSSTLVATLADWANIDPYKLLENTFGGSGYDVACAHAQQPIFFQKNNNEIQVEKTNYTPEFTDQMFFIYSGQKSNSRAGMKYFKENASFSNDDIKSVSALSEKWVKANKSRELQEIITELESRMGYILKTDNIKKEKFNDFPGALKSLGAWGGDFFLAVGNDKQETKEYFKGKNYKTIIPYMEMVYQQQMAET